MKSKILLALMFGILMLGFISSMEIDNVKYYDADNKEVTIKNSFLGIPTSNVATIKLNTPLIYYVIEGRDRKVAEFDINLAENNYDNAFKQMELYNSLDNKVINRPITYKTKSIETYEVEVNDYKEICNEGKEVNKTTGKIDSFCENVVIGRHKETREREKWTPISEDLTKGKVTIGVFTNVYAGDNVEWIPTIFGQKIQEWAKWTTVSSYLNFTFDDATNYSKQTGTKALGISNSFVGSGITAPSCIDGSCYKFTSDASAVPSITPGNTYGGWSMWINRTSNSAAGQIFSSTGSGSPFYQILWSGTSFRFFFNDAFGDTSVPWTLFPIGTWTHAYVKCNATGGYIYINGTLKASDLTEPAGSCKFFSNTANQNTFFGVAGFVDTVMDEVKFFNTELTDAQILDIYTVESGGTSSGTYSNQITLSMPQNGAVININSINFSSNNSFSGWSNISNVTYYISNDAGYFNVTTLTYPPINSTSLNVSGFTLGNYHWNVRACTVNDTNYNCSYAPSNYTFSIGATLNTSTYNVDTYETKTESFYSVFDVIAGSEVSQAQLVYNGTNYTITNLTLVGNKLYLQKAIDVPINPVGVPKTERNFFYRFTYAGASVQDSSVQQQNVTKITFGFCNSTLNQSYINFTLKDEQLNTNLVASANPITFQGFFKYWLASSSGATIRNYSINTIGNTTSNNYTFCFSPSSENIKIDADIDYSATAYSPRQKYFRNTTLTNVTTEQTLYLLNSSNAVKFYFQIIQGAGAKVNNATITIDKYDTSTATYSNVASRLSDGDGKFVEYLILDSLYRFNIVKNGVVLGVVDKSAICSAAPCEITLFLDVISSDSPFNGYYDTYANGTLSNITFDAGAKTATYSFIDITGLAHYFRFVVTKVSYNSTTATICDSSVYSSSGSIVCNLTGYSGDFMAKGYISRSPEMLDKVLAFVIDIFKNASTSPYLVLFLIAWLLTISMGSLAISRGNPSTVLFAFMLAWTSAKLFMFNPFSWIIVVLVDLLVGWVAYEIGT